MRNYRTSTYRNNEISPDFSQVVMSVSQHYNDANMMIENNDIGQVYVIQFGMILSVID